VNIACLPPGPMLLLLAGLMTAPNVLGANPDPTPVMRPVKVMQISLGTGVRERILPAEVRAAARAALSFRVPGQVAVLEVHPGDAVKAGQLLARLDPAIYEQQLEVAKAQFELARLLFERAENLVDQGVVSRSDFDKSQSDLRVAQAALDKANADLAYTRLLAPYDGVISRRYLRLFEYAKAQEPVLGIQTESAIDVSFQLPEQFVAMLQGNAAELSRQARLQVKFDSSELWFDASLKEINTVADPTTGSYTLILSLPMPEQLHVLPGMEAKVKAMLPASQAETEQLIPPGAMVRERGHTYVFRWLAEASRVERVSVEVEGGRLIAGLNDGDWLVVAGAADLTDGQSAVRWIKERGL
jgi:RND family efflux transporter MFP subunit